MKINYEKITNQNKKKVYKLWEEYVFNENEIVLNGKKDHSYEFAINEKDVLTLLSDNLASFFSIEDKDLFDKKFRMACSGNGGEGMKISTLHSSALCALLFFYNVCNNNPLVIKELPEYEFVDSVFEFKNKVIGYPSNIDIVLLGYKKSNSDEKIILFLESKFSEYITGTTNKGSKYEIGKSYFKKYKSIYNESFLEKLKIKKEKDSNYLTPLEEDYKYIEGLKQIISHYIGIRNFIKGDYSKNDEDILKRVKEYSDGKVILGEILFDSFEDESLREYQTNYENDYKILAKKLNKEIENVDECKIFTVLENVLHYSDLESFVKNQTIRNFYFGRTDKQK